MNLSLVNVAPVGLRARRKEERIIFAPNRQQGRLVRAEEVLKLWIESDIRLIVAEQVELNASITWFRKVDLIQRIAFRRNQRWIGDAISVLPFRRLGTEKGAQRVPVFRRGLFPIGLDRVPAFRIQTLFVGVAVLRNDRRNPFRIAKREAKANGRAIVENVNGVVFKAKRLREPSYRFG